MVQCLYTFASPFILLVNLFDLRTDAHRFLKIYKRPIGYKAHNIGNDFK